MGIYYHTLTQFFRNNLNVAIFVLCFLNLRDSVACSYRDRGLRVYPDPFSKTINSHQILLRVPDELIRGCFLKEEGIATFKCNLMLKRTLSAGGQNNSLSNLQYEIIPSIESKLFVLSSREHLMKGQYEIILSETSGRVLTLGNIEIESTKSTDVYNSIEIIGMPIAIFGSDYEKLHRGKLGNRLSMCDFYLSQGSCAGGSAEVQVYFEVPSKSLQGLSQLLAIDSSIDVAIPASGDGYTTVVSRYLAFAYPLRKSNDRLLYYATVPLEILWKDQDCQVISKEVANPTKIRIAFQLFGSDSKKTHATLSFLPLSHQGILPLSIIYKPNNGMQPKNIAI